MNESNPEQWLCFYCDGDGCPVCEWTGYCRWQRWDGTDIQPQYYEEERDP